MPPKVLIVDADITARMRALVPLSAAGYIVLTADDAMTAQRVAVREQPNVVVLDLKLPAGDGYQVMTRLGELPATAGTPVIVMAAEAGDAGRVRALAAGAAEYLSKPVDIQYLLATLRYVLGPLAPTDTSLDGIESFHDPTTKTILIVDDDPVSVRLIEMIVARNGYGTAGASGAAEALAILDSGRPIEMVITDQNLGGQSGLELSAKLRADVRFHNMPIILCTGVADRQVVEEAMRLGVRHFIVKPITPQIVMGKVNAVAAERPQIMDTRDAAMARLQLSDPEYKALLHASQEHLARLGAELTQATEAGDRVTAVLAAGRLREPARLLAAPRLLAAIDILEATRTWHDLEESVRLVAEEIASLESAVETESRPQLISRPLGLRGPD